MTLLQRTPTDRTCWLHTMSECKAGATRYQWVGSQGMSGWGHKVQVSEVTRCHWAGSQGTSGRGHKVQLGGVTRYEWAGSQGTSGRGHKVQLGGVTRYEWAGSQGSSGWGHKDLPLGRVACQEGLQLTT